MKTLKRVKNVYSIFNIGIMLIGAALLIWPTMALGAVYKLCGIVLIGYGAVKLIGYFSEDHFQLAFQFDLALGIVSMIIGAAMIFRTSYFINVMSACMGIFMLLDAALKIQTAIDAKRFGISRWWMILVISILVAILGILLFIHPFQAADLIVRLLGLNLLLDGILNLWIVRNTVQN